MVAIHCNISGSTQVHIRQVNGASERIKSQLTDVFNQDPVVAGDVTQCQSQIALVAEKYTWDSSATKCCRALGNVRERGNIDVCFDVHLADVKDLQRARLHGAVLCAADADDIRIRHTAVADRKRGIGGHVAQFDFITGGDDRDIVGSVQKRDRY